MRFLLPLLIACSGAPSTDPEPDADGSIHEEVTLTTRDSLSLAASFDAPAGEMAVPAVLLLHQYEDDRSQWGTWPETLRDAGYAVLAIDYRGHGDSDPYPGQLEAILTNPDGAPHDVDAALDWLRARDTVDGDRIAIVGTSIGANLAVASAIGRKAHTYVALSARQPPTESLAGAPATGMSSVLYIASEEDGGGQAADSVVMHEFTVDPKQLVIYPRTAAHGKDFLGDDFTTRETVESWLAARLGG